MNWQPSASLQVIRERARIYRQIRSFFNNRGCLEVETPVLASTTNTDVQIATIEVPGFEIPFYLQTSPEFAMKRLLAAGRFSRSPMPSDRAKQDACTIRSSACWNGTGLGMTTTSSWTR
jgi:elongation factor P--beta-lysine ligase